jgi:RNA polymerase sigma factor (sigma-70 family)
MTESPPTPPPRDDVALLLAAQRDHEAFALLYDRHATALAAWLRRRTNPDDAQELLAETFAQAWCSRRRFRAEHGSARPWLYGIAQHLLFNSYRRLQVEDRARRRLGVALEPPAATYDEADARLDAASLRADLAVRLARLGPGTREAVLLRIVEQLEYAELGARLGCSPRAARLRVSRGLRALRRDPDPATPADEPARLLSNPGALS